MKELIYIVSKTTLSGTSYPVQCFRKESSAQAYVNEFNSDNNRKIDNLEGGIFVSCEYDTIELDD